MHSPTLKTSNAAAITTLSTVVLASSVMGALYIGRDILIPLTLAALLTFLLAPLVSRVERLVGRVVAVILVVMMVFALVGGAGWVLTRQVIDLAKSLSDYKENLVSKMHSLQSTESAEFEAISRTVEELKNELPGNGKDTKNTPAVVQDKGKPETAKIIGAAEQEPVAVKVVKTSEDSPVALVQTMISPLLGPLGTAALVLLLLVFMLLKREDLRNRLIRLIGQGRIGTTTRAMEDAGKRVSRYLVMQLVVNVTYGIPLAIGLYFIGIPNAVLWGGFAIGLRFIPYVGPWIAALMPIALSLAVSPGWMAPALVLGLFIVLELVSNNVMEPWLYGTSTGVSSIALIVAAVFWTWMWGPVGLVLATPITVCLVVLGRHVPRLAFLSIILSDEDALTPPEDCYHRLLSPGTKDEIEFADNFLKAHPLAELYDAVFVPVLTMAETDARAQLLVDAQLALIKRSMGEIIDDLGTRPPMARRDEEGAETVENVMLCRVLVLPAKAERDELAGRMLGQLLTSRGPVVEVATAKMVAGELVGLVEEHSPDTVCISVVAPSTVIHARYLCVKIRERFPLVKIVVGLWAEAENLTEVAKKLRDAGANEVVTSFSEAIDRIARLAPAVAEAETVPPMPDDEEKRLAALAALAALDWEKNGVAESIDRVTARLARIFEVPVVKVSAVGRDKVVLRNSVGLPSGLGRGDSLERRDSICAHVVAADELILVEDLARDRRFVRNAWAREHGLRCYAGAPLLAPGGEPVGVLCLYDTKPRQFSGSDLRQLKEAAREIMETVAAGGYPHGDMARSGL